MRSYRIFCKNPHITYFSRIMAFSKSHMRKLCRICENSHTCRKFCIFQRRFSHFHIFSCTKKHWRNMSIRTANTPCWCKSEKKIWERLYLLCPSSTCRYITDSVFSNNIKHKVRSSSLLRTGFCQWTGHYTLSSEIAKLTRGHVASTRVANS